MLAAIRYWIAASDFAKPLSQVRGEPTKYQITQLGSLILQNDPYFEDERSLWLWHIALASNLEAATFWYWAFNEFGGVELRENIAAEQFSDFIVENGYEVPNRQSIRKDFNCFLRTYMHDRVASSPGDETVSPIASLNLLSDTGAPGGYRFNFDRHERRIDEVLVAFATFRFAETERAGRRTVSIDELRWASRSPGRLLCLDTRILSDYLDTIQRSRGWLSLTHTSGLHSVHLSDRTSTELLKELYGTATR
jgi:hypothetical protein